MVRVILFNSLISAVVPLYQGSLIIQHPILSFSIYEFEILSTVQVFDLVAITVVHLVRMFKLDNSRKFLVITRNHTKAYSSLFFYLSQLISALNMIKPDLSLLIYLPSFFFLSISLSQKASYRFKEPETQCERINQIHTPCSRWQTVAHPQ